MRWIHADHPGRALRLAYCLNLHPGDTLEAVRRGIEEITAPLARRLAHGAPFGVGMYLPAAVALELDQPGAASDVDDLRAFLAAHGLDPFTFNAFPYGGFHEAGLKEGVFAPTWDDPARLAYTLAVARLASRLGSGRGPGEHLSISTHGGRFGPFDAAPGSLADCSAAYGACVRELGAIEAAGGPRIVLSIEAEPRSSAGDTSQAASLLQHVRASSGEGGASVRRHLGTCLDACHAAVEFEEDESALEHATTGGAPLGKLQFSSALRLVAPDSNPAGRDALLALVEPVFLHQVTGRRPAVDGSAELVRARDLPEVAAAWAAGSRDWRGCDEWRCHFHVPVDLDGLTADGSGESALGTTRSLADGLLASALARPERWGTDELHVEIETYTWDILPGAARGPGDLVDGLEREYEHVFVQLEAAGWRRAPASS